MNLSVLAGVFTTILGVFYTIQAVILPEASIGNPLAPKVFPLGVGILIIFFGVTLLVKEIKKSGFKLTVSKNEADKGNVKLIAYISMICILYGLIFRRLGYVISTIIFLEIILFLFNGKEKWKINTIVAVSFSVLIYVVFSMFLGVTLPPIPFINV